MPLLTPLLPPRPPILMVLFFRYEYEEAAPILMIELSPVIDPEREWILSFVTIFPDRLACSPVTTSVVATVVVVCVCAVVAVAVVVVLVVVLAVLVRFEIDDPDATTATALP